MRQRAPFVEAVGHRERLAVIGDRDVLESGVARGGRHRADVILAVGFRRVHVQIAAQIGALDQARQHMKGGGIDFALHLTHFGRHPVESQRRVHIRFALAGQLHIVRDAEHAVLVQFQTEADRAIAQRDVVSLGPGEILHRGATAVGWDQSKIGLQASIEQNA